MTSEARIRLSVDDDGVALLTLDRPDKLNALAGDMRERLRDAVVESARNESVRALVVTGAGRAFCAGGDVEVMSRLHETGDSEGFRRLLHAGAECVLALQAFPGLTVAAINGVAAGAGMGLALACDLRIAAPEARLIASWGGIGLAPDWGATYWLPRLLGRSRALAAILARDAIGAQRAQELGLVDAIEPGERLLERARKLALERGAAREMVAAVKELVRKGAEESLEACLAAETEAQEELFESEDVREGLAAFRDKRRPEFGRER